MIDGEQHNKRAYSGLQDRNGFLWFATDDGLSRYDGYTMKNYRHDPNNSKTISSNRVRDILEDRNGILWIGTDSKGINSFDPKTEVFTRYLSDEANIGMVRHLYKDSLGLIWISTPTSGLIQLNPITGDVIRYLSDKENASSLISDDVWKVIEDRSIKGNLWVATSRGLDYFDRETKSFSHYLPKENEPFSLSNQFVLDIYYDSNDVLWAGTYNGLNQFIASNKQFLHHFPNKKDKHLDIDDNIISAVYESSDGQLFVGTEGGGLKIFDRNNKHFIEYRSDNTNAFSLRENLIERHGLFEDSSGILWVLTTVGLNKLNLSSQKFKNYRNVKGNSNSLSGNIIWAIYEDHLNRLWVGTDENGLNLDDGNNKGFVSFRHDAEDEGSLISDRVYSVLVDSDETLWVGTNIGLDRKEKGESHFEHYQFGSEKITTKIISRVYGLLEDHLGYIWIATTSGLRKYDKNNDSFKLYLPDDKKPGSISYHWIRTLFEDNMGRVWIGTARGVNLYDRSSDSFIQFKHDPTNPNSLSNNDVQVIYQSNSGYFWMGGDVGFDRFDFEQKTFKHYGKNDGLVSDIVAEIFEDDTGYLWLSGSEGLSRFEPKNEIFYNFHPEDGVQDRGYISLNSGEKLNSGELVFGGEDGLDWFSPSDFPANLTAQAQEVVLTDFLVFNRSVPLLSALYSDDKSSNANSLASDKGQFYLEQSIAHNEELELSHKESMFSFEFSSLDYLSPNKIQYAYQLQGVDNNWITTSANKRFATYMNVPAGEYLFKVKASDRRGVWSEKMKTLKVIILPPLWLTWWAKSLYLLFAIGLLISFYLIRTASLRRRTVILQKSVEDRTTELTDEKQKLTLEKNKVEQLLSRKNEEFANVSHEFRTPLTLILGPLAQVLKNISSPQEVDRLNIVQRNAYRLLRMVDQLLNLEILTVEAITQKSPQPVGKIIKSLCDAFIDYAKEKDIKLQVGHIDNINFEFTPDALEKILLNLLSNAIKYTKAGGLVEISAKRTNNNQLAVQIRDNGIGIPEDKLSTIFERYNRVIDKNSEQVTGAGIGLALVKSLVEVHQGSISITSQLEQGTSITVLLPIIGEVSDNQVSLHANQEVVAMELMSIAIQQSVKPIESKVAVVQNNDVRPTVLVIEDNQDMQNYIVENIQQSYQVMIAKDGEEGLELAKKEVPDLIVSDIMMPKKDGYQTTYELRQDDITSHIPIILLTARSDRESRLKGWQEKADEYLTKPFDIEELKIRIKNLLEIRDILKRRYSEIVFEKNLQSPEEKQPINNKGNEKFIKRMNEVLEDCYADSKLSVPALAAKLAMSDRQFFRKLNNVLDMKPSEYLRRFRLEKAKAILAEGNSANFTTFEVGFSSQSYFAKCFKAQYGISPSDYKNDN